MANPTEIAGRYRVGRRLGAGGMSTVFLAQDEVLERPVAVKLLAEHLAEDEAFVARFRREALAAARLQHPNIVQVFDSGEDPDSHRHYIVMEYVDGPSCADLLRDQKQLDVEEAGHLVRDACHGLDYAHRAGVVHRDVKPGNLLVVGDMGTTKLADFGIAKAAEQTRITQVGSVLGTAAYLSPEQARGEEAGPASDIYSLGVCAYQFLAGRLPHEYTSLTELALKQQEDTVEPIPVSRPDVPAELDQAIRMCLQREPSQRYGSALQMAQAVEAGLRGEVSEATRLLAAGMPPPANTESTRILGQATSATQALRANRSTGVHPATGNRQPLPPSRPAPQPAETGKPSKRARRLGWLMALVAVLLVGAAIAVVVSLPTGNSGVKPVDRNDAQQQIRDLRTFLRDHSR